MSNPEVLMNREEKIRIVLCFISQFNGEIRESTVKRLFDTEYDPIELSVEELSEILINLHADNTITTNRFGYLYVTFVITGV